MIADGGPSLTAQRVAAHRLGYDRVPAPYGDPAADDALAAEVAGGIQVPDGRMHDYLAVRTAFFDRIVVHAIDRGVGQIVIGGAGYDGRALRYAAPGVRWFEVDHPATQRDKLAKLRQLGLDAGHVRFVAVDFTQDPADERLTGAGLDASAPTLFLLEGVAVYLEAAVLEAVLGQFRDVAAPGSRLAISMPVTGTFRARSRFRAAVARLGEPALSQFEPSEVENLLARTGWHLAAGTGQDNEPAAARRERLSSAGLLTAQAGPRAGADARQEASRTAAFIPVDAARLPFSALLSHALVAFTIEADNEAEHRMPHRTTDHGPGTLGTGAWLVSLAMYENSLRYLGDGDPLTVDELRRLARTGTNLDGIRRWGYVAISGPKRVAPDSVLRATETGRLASRVWAPLPGLVEDRWRHRFGDAAVTRLRDSLQALATRLDPTLPDCLPILGPGLFSRRPDPLPPPSGRPVTDLPLSALMSRALLAVALDFERESGLSLPVSSNVLRLLTTEGVRLRDLRHLAGVSKESIAMAMRSLQAERLAVVAREIGSRWRIARLTPKGLAARRAYAAVLADCEQRLERLEPDAIQTIREVLEPLAGTGGAGGTRRTDTASDAEEAFGVGEAGRSDEAGRLGETGGPGETDTAGDTGGPGEVNGPLLFAGLKPYPDGWRAAVPPPAALPYYPMVLHRGGYPDGS